MIGKQFSSAGLSDIVIGSDVIEERSVDRVLTGKVYNWAVKFNKLIYEACM